MSHLVEGRIPAHACCPWRSQCPLASGLDPACRHTGVEHDVPFSCASARAFEICDTAPDKLVSETRMPFMYRVGKTKWVVKMAYVWDLHVQSQAWQWDHRLAGETFVPSLDLEEETWVFDDPIPRANELAALRKMQELWAALDFTGV